MSFFLYMCCAFLAYLGLRCLWKDQFGPANTFFLLSIALALGVY